MNRVHANGTVMQLSNYHKSGVYSLQNENLRVESVNSS